MARRSNTARLLEGMTLLDFASPAAVMRAFQGDEKRIRAEYSRQRSIVRKRVERMAAAGETENFVYRKYGDLKKALPTADQLTTSQMLSILTDTGSTIAGGYQSTLRDIKKRRRTLRETIREGEAKRKQAEAEQKEKEKGKEGKKAPVEAEEEEEEGKELSEAQLIKIQRLMGMTEKGLGKAKDSDEILAMATDIVTRKGASKRSLLSMATEILSHFDAELADVESMKDKYTSKGTVRVSWSKAHGKRGK